MSSAGVADLISHYGGLLNNSSSLESYYETGQGRLGSGIWRTPELFIKNSPIFNADKVTAPLLMMNNNNDGIVHFSQGVEFFTALRRLGKRVWMLQYDGEDHVISNKKTALQHTLRVTQFFDHYLKDAPAPKWMTRGIPAAMKGIDDGMELDYEIKTPGEGLLIKQDKKK
jgi:dipeptidyl aminopeptidase/acylaminoacyl peptidase